MRTFNHNFVTPPELEKVTLDNGQRHYVSSTGEVFESVTTYIGRHWDKKYLEQWKKRVGESKANAESKRTADRGTRLHKVIESYLMNDAGHRRSLSENVFTKSLFLKVRPYLDKVDNIRLIEKSIYSNEMKLAGTPDCIADYDRVLSTIDMKTSTRDKEEKWITTYWLQTAIYSLMFNELYGEMPQQSVIIMAVEDNPQPRVFIESTYKGQQRLAEFIEDPIKFQKLLGDK